MMKAYCDSSFDEKKGIAGIGIVIENGTKRRLVSNWIKARSNNEAELFAIYLAGILTENNGVITFGKPLFAPYFDDIPYK